MITLKLSSSSHGDLHDTIEIHSLDELVEWINKDDVPVIFHGTDKNGVMRVEIYDGFRE